MVCSVHVHVCFFFSSLCSFDIQEWILFNEMGFHYWARGSTLKSKD